MIGENIQCLRKRKSITQEALAEMVGVSRQTIAKWESGESAPDLEMSGKLSQALDVSLDDLANAPLYEMPKEAAPVKGRHILENFDSYIPAFKKIIPRDYERMISAIAAYEGKGESREQAEIAAFYAAVKH